MSFPSITSTAQFKQVALEWLNQGMHSGDTEAELDAFVDWMHEESENWLSFEEWEQFCMDNNMA